jgi:hypothetical protein
VNLVEAIRDARAGKARSIKCPAHHDRKPSLSVSPGTGGSVLIWCWARCAPESVLAAAGLRWADICGNDALPTERAGQSIAPAVETEDPTKAEQRAAWPKFIEPTAGDLGQIATLRGLGIEGLRVAVNRGILRVAIHHGHRSWIVTDSARMAAQARRLDGKPWRVGDGSPKALTLPGSIGAWPVGVAALTPEHRSVLLCEGGPDLLAGFHFIAAEGRGADTSAVAMMGASCRIRESELHRFEGRRVRICEQDDKAGREATEDWARQLHPHVERLDAVRFDGLRQVDGKPVEDLNDLCRIHADDFEANRWTWEVIP